MVSQLPKHYQALVKPPEARKPKKFLVATAVGGVQEHPEIDYEKFDVIEGSTAACAKATYDVKHNCSYFYGEVIAEVIDGKVTLPVSYFIK